MSGEQMERKYLYALILVAFVGGFAAGAVTTKMSHVQPISRFTPIGKNGFEAFDTVTGQECVSASMEEVKERLKIENPRAQIGNPQAEDMSQRFDDPILDPKTYHGMVYCSSLAK